MASSDESTMAASRARSSSRSCRSVMSRATFDAPMIFPCASLTGDTVNETGTRRPSLVRRTVSKCSILSPRRRRARTSSSSVLRSSGMIREICWPTASAAVYPKSRAAPRFHDVMTPSSVLLTMASSEESTMAARRACISLSLVSSVAAADSFVSITDPDDDNVEGRLCAPARRGFRAGLLFVRRLRLAGKLCRGDRQTTRR